MSRSKHTDPRSIRAARRLRAPNQRPGAGDLSDRRRIGRKLRELGVMLKGNERLQDPGPGRRVRITIQPPRPGHYHPITERDIEAILKAVGPIASYGLRSAELRRAPAGRSRCITFGRYCAPGRILLYEQPFSPWRLPGIPAEATLARFQAAGAMVTILPGPNTAIIDWPEGTLRRFMLEEVLLHEIGHHYLQHHKGKRPVRIARTRDHEAFASRFAKKQRVILNAAVPALL